MNADQVINNSLGTLVSVASLGVAAQLAISLPESVSVAPITGQSLAVLLVAHLLKEKWASIAVIVYLAIGTLGAPIFAGFKGGWEIFTGPSLGYFLGFILAAFVGGFLARKQQERFGFYLLQMLIGTLLILLCGWIGLFRFLDGKEAFVKGILPFLPGAFIKIIIGALLLSVVRRFKGFMKTV
ncbi:MAG: biotin transport system substrate-specific component [Vicingaceae bacterium]|jgi:biotin transport system substrate-specific component